VALVGDPALLFLDEPTTGLDPHSRREVWEIISECRRHGRTTVLTTHYMEEAERLCDRIAIIDQGRVIALGSPPYLIAQLGGEHIVEFSLASLSCGAAVSTKESGARRQEYEVRSTEYGQSEIMNLKSEISPIPNPQPPIPNPQPRAPQLGLGAALSPDAWLDLPAVTACHYENGSICLTVTEPHVVLPALLQRLEERGWQLARLVTRHASLDDVFIALAGHKFEPHGEAQG
jgi:ABC-2 type transport system ATP-binding protein